MTVTVEEWARCPYAHEATRDELVFTITAGGKRVAIRHPRCGYEVAFPQLDLASLTWPQVEAAVGAHLPAVAGVKGRRGCSSRIRVGDGDDAQVYHCDGTHPEPKPIPVDGPWHTSAHWTQVTGSAYTGWADAAALWEGASCTQGTCAEPSYHTWTVLGKDPLTMEVDTSGEPLP